MRRLFAALFLAFTLVDAHGALAREVIENFSSEVLIQPDGTLEVTEEITVIAEGRDIRRGIYRDFPTRYREESGLFRTVGFDVVEIKRNGKAEPWFTEQLPGGVRIYIGNKEAWIATGRHTYTIRYETTRQIGFFDDYDELYWNVTGNFWRFPIQDASARIVLPEGTNVRETAAYTGPVGSTAFDAVIDVPGPRTAVFRATRRLEPGEGLTVAVSWQKGIVPESSGGSFRAILDNLGLGVLGAGALALLTYFQTMWRRVGRDPEKGVIFPRFHPPKGLSPAVVSYIYFRGFSVRTKRVPRAFVAALVSLATKGILRFEDADGTIGVVREGDLPPTAPPGEEVIFLNAFAGRERFNFTKSNGKTLLSTVSGFSGAILKEYGDRFFRDNRGVFILGAILSVAVIAAGLFLYQPEDTEIVAMVATALSAILAALALTAGVRRLRGTVPGGSVAAGVFFTAMGGLLLAVLAGAFAIPTPLPFDALRLAVAAIIFMNVVFLHLLTAPTVQGQAIIEEIEGFRMYLSVAEAERLNMKDAPDFSTDLFERYLPFAIGLNVEKPWSEALEAHLAKNGQADSYRPFYYRGSNWSSGKIATSTAGLASTVGSSIASAMPAPKSSGGSGGGGFSGGGGGGGGGGGW